MTKFKRQMFLLLFVLLLCWGAGFYFLYQVEYYIIGILLISAGIIPIVRVLTLVNRTNKYLANFLLSIKYDDFETHYTKGNQEKEEKALFGAFNLINDKFRDLRQEKEAQYQFFQLLIQNVGTGVLSFDENGKTTLMNKAIRQLLHKSHFVDFESIKAFDEELYHTMKAVSVGQSVVFKKTISNQTLQLTITKNELSLREKVNTIYSFHDINSELQAQEMQSWQKLIQILTHEIMNSIAPVVSLAHTTHDVLESNMDMDTETRTEINKAVETIYRRSEGLLKFTETYRKLSKIPPPQKEEIDAKSLMDGVLDLMISDINKNEITLNKDYTSKACIIKADPAQMEQVFINLIKNALEALIEAENKVIDISIHRSGEAVVFKIADSGPGIPSEIADQIFVPFFTSKKDGSGIGLSICQQIIFNHDGNIQLVSDNGMGTEFLVTI